MSILHLALELMLIVIGAKALGRLVERAGQPRVLGELAWGVLIVLLPTLFGIAPGELFRNGPALGILAKGGMALLLFEAGLESDTRQLIKEGPHSFAVACTGVALPFVLGWGLMTLLAARTGLPLGGAVAVFVGGAMTATSVGITARVLGDLGRLGTREARIILGAAVIDDILGLVILSAVQILPRETAAAAGAGASSAAHILQALLLPAAFFGGAALAQAGRAEAVSRLVRPAAWVLVPVFFVLAGMEIVLSSGSGSYVSTRAGSALSLAAIIVPAAILGKLASGWAARSAGLNRLAVGVGMIPRGEVGLVFAQLGRSSGILDDQLYAALVAMVAVTTVVTPPLLKRVLK
ncbi:MAG: cation:proton antiporter [Proteobacteria bacterium]|nr:cation:proton antiporter [Pseudomonadota bacterium]